MITGQDTNGNDNIVIVELKQWGKALKIGTIQDHSVYSDLEGGKAVPHPCYQAYSYKRSIENYCEEVNKEHISPYPCAYLHNLGEYYRAVIEDGLYSDWVEEAPVFLSHDALKLRNFIKQYIKPFL